MFSVAAIAVLVSARTIDTSSDHAPAMQLTALGRELLESDLFWLQAATNKTILGGSFIAPSIYDRSQNATFYTPDAAIDKRHHYPGNYVRDFLYTFSFAPDIVPGAHVRQIADYLLSGQDPANGEMPEGGQSPSRPGMNCWDNGPMMAIFVARYYSLYRDPNWLCGIHPQGGRRVDRVLAGLHFLEGINVSEPPPHLVVAGSHCMYGFTDGEYKSGRVLFTSLLVIQGAMLMRDAILEAQCASRSEAAQFGAIATAVNASLSSGGLGPSLGSSGLFLATDGQDGQPDIWGSGLAVYIGAGTFSQREQAKWALTLNWTMHFRWGQARHLPEPLCWYRAGIWDKYMNPNKCKVNGHWCRGKEACGSYQNGGYWATPLYWLLPVVASANFTLATRLLKDVIADFKANGINEAVNHDFWYDPQDSMGGPATYVGVMGYLASASSVYGAVWQPSTPRLSSIFV